MTTKKCYGLGEPSSFWVAGECASEQQSFEGEGNEELSLSFPAPRSRISCCEPLERDFSRYPFRENWSQAVTVVIVARDSSIVILAAQSIPKVPIPQKHLLGADISIPSDRNIALKEIDKGSKYKDLELEIQRMWQMKTEVIPVVVGVLGTVQ